MEITETISVERTYSLGNYQNIKVRDEISGIPFERMQDESYTTALNNLLLLRLDGVFYQYTKDSRTFVEGVTTEKALEYIADASLQAQKSLSEY